MYGVMCLIITKPLLYRFTRGKTPVGNRCAGSDISWAEGVWNCGWWRMGWTCHMPWAPLCLPPVPHREKSDQAQRFPTGYSCKRRVSEVVRAAG